MADHRSLRTDLRSDLRDDGATRNDVCPARRGMEDRHVRRSSGIRRSTASCVALEQEARLMAEPFLGASTVFDGDGFQQVECLRSRRSPSCVTHALFRAPHPLARLGFLIACGTHAGCKGRRCGQERACYETLWPHSSFQIRDYSRTCQTSLLLLWFLFFRG